MVKPRMRQGQPRIRQDPLPFQLWKAEACRQTRGVSWLKCQEVTDLADLAPGVVLSLAAHRIYLESFQNPCSPLLLPEIPTELVW